jgi:hypothetical protein
VGITSDTQYFDGVGRQFKNADLLVVHLGSVYPPDAGYFYGADYWHLGVNGTVRLLLEAKDASDPHWDPLVIISEWGEEVNECRTDVCNVVKNATGIDRLFPAELDACIALYRRDARPLCGMADCTREAVTWDRDKKTHDLKYSCDEH